jgi:hypothetical protein
MLHQLRAYMKSIKMHDQINPLGRSKWFHTDLGKRPECFLVCVQKSLDSFPFRYQCFILMQQLAKHVGPVQLADKAILHLLRGVVDEEMHNSLRDEILNRLSDDAKVRFDQRADERSFHFLSSGQSRRFCRSLRNISISALERRTAG